MAALFLRLVNMSIAAAWLVGAVLLLRPVMKRAPRWTVLFLWAAVALRLALPFSFESELSLLPSAETVPEEIIYTDTPQIHTGISTINGVVNPFISDALSPKADSAPSDASDPTPTPMERITDAAATVWIAGIGVLAVYTAVSYIRIRLKVRERVLSNDGVYLCDRVASPFVLGMFPPKIYVPSSTDGEDIPYIIAHERAHIRRFDFLWKPLGFALLTLHWFNPIMWVAYVLFCRDIEIACDEKVIRTMGGSVKKPYSTALINCSVSRRSINACPVAFGEGDVSGRVKSVLSYKKPALWIIIAALVVSAVVGVCFLTDPPSEDAPAEDTLAEDALAEDTLAEDSLSETEPLIYPIYQDDEIIRFTLENSHDPISPASVTLNPQDRSFVFNTSVLDSNYITGTYTIKENRLTLMVDGDKKNGIYTFEIIGENRISFVAELSLSTPSYKFEAGGEVLPTVPDGGEFVSSQKIFRVFPDGSMAHSSYISAEGDVDGDGVTEKCYMLYEELSGPYGYSVKMVIFEGTEVEYRGWFSTGLHPVNFLGYRFYERSDGSLGIRHIAIEKTSYYNIVCTDDDVSLEPVTEDTAPPKDADVDRDTVTLMSTANAVYSTISSIAIPVEPGSVKNEFSTIVLDMKEGTFAFGYGEKLTDLAEGTFSLTDKELVLTHGDNIYLFRRYSGNVFVFDESGSDKLPSFSYSDGPGGTISFFYNGVFVWAFGETNN